MAQGEFTEECLKDVEEAFKDLVDNAIPKKRLLDYIGHLNDIYLFFGACKREMSKTKEGGEDADSSP